MKYLLNGYCYYAALQATLLFLVNPKGMRSRCVLFIVCFPPYAFHPSADNWIPSGFRIQRSLAPASFAFQASPNPCLDPLDPPRVPTTESHSGPKIYIFQQRVPHRSILMADVADDTAVTGSLNGGSQNQRIAS